MPPGGGGDTKRILRKPDDALKPAPPTLCPCAGEMVRTAALATSVSNTRCMWLLLSNVRCGLEPYTLVRPACCAGKFTHCRLPFMASKAAPEEKRPMPAGLPVALALLAQVAAAP